MKESPEGKYDFDRKKEHLVFINLWNVNKWILSQRKGKFYENGGCNLS